jgi:PKD repeat protein
MRVEFQATPWSSVDAINFQWFFGDGTTGNGANPTKIYGVPGLFYQVTLVASNSCGGKDTLTKSLTTVGLDAVPGEAMGVAGDDVGGAVGRATVADDHFEPWIAL